MIRSVNGGPPDSAIVMHLVIDVGTSGIRTAVVRPDATMVGERYQRFLPSSPSPGAVEFDAAEMARLVLESAEATMSEVGPVHSVGIANQRASTVVWDRRTGQPVGPGVGWQDLRTVGTCLVLQGDGLRLAPNASATKVAFLLDQHDPDRSRDLCFGTVDSWLVWVLTKGALHVTDASNAAITGLATVNEGRIVWDQPVLDRLRIPASMLPEIVDSSGALAPAVALPGAPPIAGIAGDQQASLVGQGCVQPGLTKITFGTGAMLDMCVGPTQPSFGNRGSSGSLPVVAWQLGGVPTWGVETIMLSAGTAVEWLRDDLKIIDSAEASESVAAACDDAGGVFFVPALLGLGAPVWDYGARATFVGITRGTGRAEMVRAVLEGVAHRGADLVEAAETDSGRSIETLRVDGGMTANGVFLQALADSTDRPVEVSPMVEATALGAGFLAGLATGSWGSLDDLATTWRPRLTVEPRGRASQHSQWLRARERALGWFSDLSAIQF